MGIFNGIIGDSVSGVIKGLLGAILPPPLRWLGDLIPLVVEAVKMAEKSNIGKGPIKMNAVRRQVVSNLDMLDAVPGWNKLSEDSRDGLISGLAELVVFGLNVEKHGGLPPRAAARDRFADALSEISYAVFEIVDLASKDKK
jgi:hypothetical protein